MQKLKDYLKFSNIIVIAFFVIYFVIGFLSYDDYGFSWDEEIQRDLGRDVYHYVIENNDDLFINKDKYYGPFFEFILKAGELNLGITDIRDVYLFRHFLTFIYFHIGVIFFYLLCYNRFKDWKIALLGAFFLAFTPRLFADSFYNSKDIPFLASMVVSFYTAHKLFQRPSYNRALVHGLACGICICVRIVGIVVPAITLGLFIARLLLIFHKDNDRVYLKNQLKMVVVYALSLVFFTYLFWPTLWENPIRNFIRAFSQMKQYPQEVDLEFFGRIVTSTDLPWYYAPAWILISSPISHLIAFVVGVFYFVRELSKKRLNIMDISVFAWLLLPFFAVIGLQSVLYDAWRQMFFVYPAILYIALLGIYYSHRYIRTFLLIVTTLNMFFVLSFIYKAHPLQITYFNLLAGDEATIHERFDTEYWGLSYRQGLEYILSTDTRPLINVQTYNMPGRYNAYLLRPEDRARLNVQRKMENPDYYLTNYRYKDDMPVLDESKRVHTIYVGKIPVLGVYKFK